MTHPFARVVIGVVAVYMTGCTHPFQRLESVESMAIVSVTYNATMHVLDVHQGLLDAVFVGGQMNASMRRHHEVVLTQFLAQLMQQVNDATILSLKRPARLVNTSLMHATDAIIQYEYLLEPYDPIDMNHRLFMSGLAKRLNVTAVMGIDIQFGLWIDQQDLWDDMTKNGPNVPYRQAVSDSHESSIFRTQVTITIVDHEANLIVSDTSYVDTQSDGIAITNLDLAFPGGVSPKLIENGLNQWLNEWLRLLPESTATMEDADAVQSW